MKKITIVDPWGKSGLNEYVQGYVDALLLFTSDITIITNYRSTINKKQGIFLKRKFFKYSEKLTISRNLRLIIRGIEYVILQLYIAFFTKSKIIHFQWLLFPTIDIWIIKILKFRNKTVYYTAHNSKPHNSEIPPKQIQILQNVDLIIVHGKIIKNEIKDYGIQESKILIVPHVSKHNYINKKQTIPKELKQRSFQKKDKIFLFIGLVNPNKGVKELLEEWGNIFQNKNSPILIIAGKINPKIKKDIISFRRKGIIIIDRFLEEEELSFLFHLSNLILMPYKNGSISGVLFNAAAFKKPVLTSNFGSISEYIVHDCTSFIAKDFQDFQVKLNQLSSTPSANLEDIGVNNYNFIDENCSPKKIASILYKYYE